MNKSRSYEERWNYLKNKEFNLAPEWIQAFIDGEGTFQCRIAETISRGNAYIAVNPTLEIAQKSHDVFVLNAIIKYLGIGYLKPKYDILSLKECKNSRIVSRAVFNQFDLIINFVDKYPMLTRKQLDYIDWKEIIERRPPSAGDVHRPSSGGCDELKILWVKNLFSLYIAQAIIKLWFN